LLWLPAQLSGPSSLCRRTPVWMRGWSTQGRNRDVSRLSEERHLHFSPTSPHPTATPQNAGHAWPPASSPQAVTASKVAQWRARCHECPRHATRDLASAEAIWCRFPGPAPVWCKTHTSQTLAELGLLQRYRAGSGAPEAPRAVQSSGARRGTIHTQPMRPATLTSAAVTNAAVK